MKEKSFPYSDTGKRYHTFDYEMKKRFGGKCVKLPLDCGFTCPNRDGKKGIGGCTFCSARGGGEFAGTGAGISEQLESAKRLIEGKWKAERFIAYFQAFTNTYTTVERLRVLCNEALRFPGVIGISIATRADCINADMSRFLHELAGSTFLTVELGLQTVHDITARRINRCHSYADFLKGYHELDGIERCVHLINGLPGESYEMMIESAREVASLLPDFLKIHLLHVIKGTAAAREYEEGLFRTLEYDEYINTVCDQIELMPPETTIERLTGDGAAESLIAPLWSKDKRRVLNGIDKTLAARGSWQGILFK